MRYRKREDERRVVVSVRLEPAIVEQIDRAAATSGKTRSEFVNDNLVMRIRDEGRRRDGAAVHVQNPGREGTGDL